YCMSKHWFLFLILVFSLHFGYCQSIKALDSLKTVPFIDTLLIDRDINNWSVRLFGSFREQRFILSNKNNKLRYVPNNPVGVGFGLATKKLIADFTINIIGNEEKATKRVDFNSKLLIKNHHFDLFLQDYEGFEVKNDLNDETIFRPDIETFVIGINYLYLFDVEKLSFSGMHAGLYHQKKAAYSFGVGGFVEYGNLNADTSIIPNEFEPLFNEQAQITHSAEFALGVKGGIISVFPLGKNFYAIANAIPGLGITLKNIETADLSYRPANPLIFDMELSGGIGYNAKRYYVILTVRTDLLATSLGFDNNSLINETSAKLAIGYRLGRKNREASKK
ncbi:MAG: DUF4421 family protein, partial [Eudoraea sp.]|uniref:DUF4421 family protein n=1 Tax=Eudoraea sp. TaxID=1979955 RepID=UPI003C767E71